MIQQKQLNSTEVLFLQQPFIQNKFLGGVCADPQGNRCAVQQHPQNPGHAGQDLSRNRGQQARGVTKVKTWNVRDQTDTTLAVTLDRTYKEIKNAYKLSQQAATIEDAKF